MTLLETKNLSLSIANKTICRDLNLTFQPGEIWGMLGPNGSGKTSLLHALADLQTIAQGEIWLKGKKISHHSRRAVAQEIGVLFQDFNPVFSQTVWEYCQAARFPHVAYYKKNNTKDEAIILDALKTMELDLHLKKNIHHLSGGEKRRLAIASLLAQTPSIYLLDEPTNHLDLRHQIKTLNIFRSLAKTKMHTVIMALHDINHAQQYCDRMLLLFSDGEVQQGNVENLLTKENLTRLFQCSIEFWGQTPVNLM